MTTIPKEGDEGMMVADLLNATNSGWNERKLRHLMNARDCEKIWSIPISYRSVDDKLMWRFDKKGMYSVKSAYRVMRSETFSGRNKERVQMWRKLWCLNIPEKAKHVSWRCFIGYMPTKNGSKKNEC